MALPNKVASNEQNRWQLDPQGLLQLARANAFRPFQLKSLPAHAIRSLIIARKQSNAVEAQFCPSKSVLKDMLMVGLLYGVAPRVIDWSWADWVGMRSIKSVGTTTRMFRCRKQQLHLFHRQKFMNVSTRTSQVIFWNPIGTSRSTSRAPRTSTSARPLLRAKGRNQTAVY